MDKFFMFCNYSSEGLREISAQRTVQMREMVERMGGKVRGIYALLGEYD